VDELETERLILRQLTLADLDDLAAMYADPEVRRHFPDGTLSREETLEELEWFIDIHYERYGFGLWATVRKDNGRCIGRCGLLPWLRSDTRAGDLISLEPADEEPPEPERLEVEVAYLLARDQWGCGFATEAARATVDHAREVLGLSRLICLFEPENLASANVARKIAMTYETDVVIDGERLPLYSRSLTHAP
jgi:RimJ/RimL family protein N-acetyltransferase